MPRYRLTQVVRDVYQIDVEASDESEAEAMGEDIDLDSWDLRDSEIVEALITELQAR